MAFDPEVRPIAIDPEGALIEGAAREEGDRPVLGCLADTHRAAEALIGRAVPPAQRRLAHAGALINARPVALLSFALAAPVIAPTFDCRQN